MGEPRLTSATTGELPNLMASAPYLGHVKQHVENQLARVHTALDLGCGPGLRDLRILRAMGVPTLVGMDIGQRPDRLVRGDTICYVSADIDAHHLPAADGSFDLVIMDNVIEHMYDPRRVLSEASRVLRVGGMLAVLTPNQARFINRVRLLLGRSVYYPLDYWVGTKMEHIDRGGQRVFAGHIREYTLGELRTMMELVDLRVFSSHVFHAARPSSRLTMSKSRVLLGMYNFLERIVPEGGYMISVLAVKPGT